MSRHFISSREALLRAMIEAWPDPVFVKTRENRYVVANGAFLTTCGLAHAEGKTDEELFPEAFVATVRHHDDQVMKHARTIQAEERLMIGGQPRAFHVTKFPLFAPDGSVLAMGGIALDITERREAERANDALRVAQLRTEAASEAKSRLLSTVSHELRTPLSGIIGLGDLLADSLEAGQSREIAGHIARAGRDLMRILNDLLDLSRAEAGRLEVEVQPTSVREALASVAKTLGAPAAARGLAITVHVDEAVPPWVRGDSGRLRQVLMNLLGNAIKFSENGPITARVAVSGAPASRHLQVSVEDRGIGISPDDAAKIFLPFEQVRDGQRVAPGGSGLGLAICRNLVSLMGGDIGVDSRPRQGSRFWFTLPLSPCDAPAPATAKDATSFSAGALGGRVLVVDDCATNQMLTRTLLTRLGVEVEVAASGEGALHLAVHRPFDAVLLDYHLPDMDGPDLARAMEQALGAARPPIIALTATAGAEERQACAAVGMDAYLLKPVSLDALAASLRAVLSAPERGASA